jgi:hypothetical protein
MERGIASMVYRHGGGRQPKLLPRQKKRLVARIEAGPQVVGFETASRRARRFPQPRSACCPSPVARHDLCASRPASCYRQVALPASRPLENAFEFPILAQRWALYAPNNVAKRSVEFVVRLAREQLRPTYGQGFRGAPLQTDTEEHRPQTIRPGGSRAKVTQSTSKVSRSEEEI